MSSDREDCSSSSEEDSDAVADDAPTSKSESSLSAMDPASDGAPCCTDAASTSASVIPLCHTPCMQVCCWQHDMQAVKWRDGMHVPPCLADPAVHGSTAAICTFAHHLWPPSNLASILVPNNVVVLATEARPAVHASCGPFARTALTSAGEAAAPAALQQRRQDDGGRRSVIGGQRAGASGLEPPDLRGGLHSRPAGAAPGHDCVRSTHTMLQNRQAR
jgi:hypothetical protein